MMIMNNNRLLLITGSFIQVLLRSIVMASDEDCNEPLGLGSRYIWDSNMTSSSSRSPNTTFGPHQARLYNAHAWCAATDNASQYVEADLGLVVMLKSLAVQGNPHADQFVQKFSMSYAVNKDHWLDYIEIGARRIFQGSRDGETVTKSTLITITPARYIRIQPITWYGNVCLRVELYGCAADSFVPLGMTSGAIPNTAITASSFWASTSHVPHWARLYWTNENSFQSWSARTSDVNQWLKIDLSRLCFVTAVATQRRFNNEQRVKSYKLMYSSDNSAWTVFVEGRIDKVFVGNVVQSEAVVRHLLSRPIYARYVRFHPVTWVTWISMRVEVYTFGRDSPGDLGIASKEVPNSQITASTSYNSDYAAFRGRLHHYNSGASWCPAVVNGAHYLMFDLGHIMLVTGVVTHGRGKGGQRWVTGYQVSHSLDSIQWTFCKENSTSPVKIFQGNNDTTGYVTRLFNRKIKARYIRFHPKTWSPQNTHLCMRAGIVGQRKGKLGSPVFDHVTQDVTVYQQEDVALQCQVVGDSPITTTWSHDGKVIQSSTSKSALTLQSVNSSHAGSYTCTTTNALGTNFRSLHLEVKEALEICVKHISLHDDSRLSTHGTTTIQQDDSSINEAQWYTFTGQTGFYRMPMKCVPRNSCNGASPGWLSGTHPTVEEGLVKREACFHGNTDCCQYSATVFVKNCYTFYVYKLKRVDVSWKARYCAEDYKNENPYKLFQSSPDHICRALEGHMIHRVYGTSNDLACMRYCIADFRCRSFNYNHVLGTCELNNATADEHPGNLGKRPGYHYSYEVLP